MKPAAPDGSLRRSTESALEPLGSRQEVIARLAVYNTGPDGSGPEGLGDTPGIGLLHGPGFVVEIPTALEEISQVMVTVTDEDFAWSVLSRLCRQLQWKMLDPETGRSFG
jgi:hypothetical protein